MTSASIEARIPEFRIACVETASASIGKLSSGCRKVGITKGQYSLLDLIRAVIDQTGPAHLILSTWTTGIRDAENAGWLLEKKQLLSVEILTDRSFPGRQPKYCRRLREIFGDGAIFVTNTHAKFAIIHNDNWQIVIRSSMNLNRNKRFEQWDLDDSPELCQFFRDFVDECKATTPQGILSTEHDVEEGFKRALAASTCGGDIMLSEAPEDVAERVVQLAGLQFLPEEIMTLAGLEQWTDELETAYLRGQLAAEEPIRRILLAQASSGDMQAIDKFRKLAIRRQQAE